MGHVLWFFLQLQHLVHWCSKRHLFVLFCHHLNWVCLPMLATIYLNWVCIAMSPKTLYGVLFRYARFLDSISHCSTRLPISTWCDTVIWSLHDGILYKFALDFNEGIWKKKIIPFSETHKLNKQYEICTTQYIYKMYICTQYEICSTNFKLVISNYMGFPTGKHASVTHHVSFHCVSWNMWIWQICLLNHRFRVSMIYRPYGSPLMPPWCTNYHGGEIGLT